MRYLRLIGMLILGVPMGIAFGIQMMWRGAWDDFKYGDDYE
jgi:hypothetical protein